MRGLLSLLVIAALAGCAPQGVAEPDPTAVTSPDRQAGLPIILRDKGGPGLEALLAGRLTRRGDCLYLDFGSGKAALIVWGDDVRAARLNEDGWIVSDATTSQRFVEGDWLSGAGGVLSEQGGVETWTGAPPPGACDAQPAVSLYDVRKGETAPPPPPPPLPPGQQTAGLRGETVEPLSRPDVAEALFRHMFEHNASGGQRSVAAYCLNVRNADPPPDFIARFADVRPRVVPASACTWREPRVVERATGDPALRFSIDAMRCASEKVCEARGGYAEANLSASGNRFRLEQKGGKWVVTQDILEVIS